LAGGAVQAVELSAKRNFNLSTPLMTDCLSQVSLGFHSDKRIDVAFDAPEISSDGGWLLLRQMDDKLGLTEWFASLVPDGRDLKKTQHTRWEQVRQRVLQIAMAYEDCNDADHLRQDKVLKMACNLNPEDPSGLSSQPTLSRFENSADMSTVVKLIKAFEDTYVASLPDDTDAVVIDIDGTADPTHGAQQLSMFNKFYDQHMYFPLPFFDGDGRLITALLRPGNVHDCRGVKYLLARIIGKLKARFPAASILVRGDSKFSLPRITLLLEQLDAELGGIEYLLGLQTNPVLKRLATEALDGAQRAYAETGRKARRFSEFLYKARSWPRHRHVVARVEVSTLGADIRFVVTTLNEFPAGFAYDRYCARGSAENHIKNLKNALHADRLSCSTFVANFFRLLLYAAAYRLMYGLRLEVADVSPQLGRKQMDTLRLRLLKVAAIVSQSVRRILLRLPAVFPLRATFRTLLRRLNVSGPATAT
jgi:hypothetical protein